MTRDNGHGEDAESTEAKQSTPPTDKPLIVIRPLVVRRPDGSRELHVLPLITRGRHRRNDQ